MMHPGGRDGFAAGHAAVATARRAGCRGSIRQRGPSMEVVGSDELVEFQAGPLRAIGMRIANMNMMLQS
jgi:hypothetical protein